MSCPGAPSHCLQRDANPCQGSSLLPWIYITRYEELHLSPNIYYSWQTQGLQCVYLCPLPRGYCHISISVSWLFLPPSQTRDRLCLLWDTSEKTQAWRANGAGRARRARPPKSKSHGEKRRVTGTVISRGAGGSSGDWGKREQSLEEAGSRQRTPTGRTCPNQPSRAWRRSCALHDMSHSPEPRPCVSAAGEREPAQGLRRGVSPFLPPLPRQGPRRGDAAAHSRPTHGPRKKAVPAASVPTAWGAPQRTKGEVGCRDGGVCVERLTGSATVTKEEQGWQCRRARVGPPRDLLPAGRTSHPRPSSPSFPRPAQPASPSLVAAASPALTCSRQRRPRRRPPAALSPQGGRPTSTRRPHTPLRRAVRAHARHPGGGAGRCRPRPHGAQRERGQPRGVSWRRWLAVSNTGGASSPLTQKQSHEALRSAVEVEGASAGERSGRRRCSVLFHRSGPDEFLLRAGHNPLLLYWSHPSWPQVYTRPNWKSYLASQMSTKSHFLVTSSNNLEEGGASLAGASVNSTGKKLF